MDDINSFSFEKTDRVYFLPKSEASQESNLIPFKTLFNPVESNAEAKQAPVAVDLGSCNPGLALSVSPRKEAEEPVEDAGTGIVKLPNEVYLKIDKYLSGEDRIKFTIALACEDRPFATFLLARGINQKKMSIRSVFENCKENLYFANSFLQVECIDLSDFCNKNTAKVLDFLSENECRIDKLILPDDYNQAIPNTVLEKLRTLTVGKCYDQPFSKDVNLANLQVFTMGMNYNQPLPPNLANLQTLTMGMNYNQPLPSTLGNLQILTMGMNYNQPLPPNLANLQTLTMGMKYNQPLSPTLANLKTLIMGWNYNQPLPSNLANLQILSMGGKYNQPLPTSLGNLQSLTMGWGYNQLLPTNLRNLQSLIMGWEYNQPLPPNFGNVHSLVMGKKYNQLLPSDLGSLQTVVIGSNYRQPLPEYLNLMPDEREQSIYRRAVDQ